MASKSLNVTILTRSDTEANFSTTNPVLAAGEMAISTDKGNLFKVGDGVNTWADLNYNTVSWDQIVNKPSADGIGYNNETSHLGGGTVQAAIDEIKGLIDAGAGIDTTYTLSAGTGEDSNKIVLTPSNGTPDKVTVPYATSAGNANTVNNKTVAANVPADAKFTDNNTTYSFANGTNGFTVTPSGGSAQTVSVSPSFSVGTGDSNGQVKINGTNASVKGLGNDAYTSTNNVVYINNDIPEGATNLSTTANAHKITTYRNGLTIPYQMDNANDGGIIRCRGTSENNCIFEIGTWDDSGDGETIQFNYYPTTSQVTPTYSVSVPKKSGVIALDSDISSLRSSFQAGVDSIYNAIKAQGTTPASKSLSDVVNAIGTMSNNRYNSGYSNGYNKGVSDADGRSNPSSYNYQTGYNAGYNKGKADGDVKHTVSVSAQYTSNFQTRLIVSVDGSQVYNQDVKNPSWSGSV